MVISYRIQPILPLIVPQENNASNTADFVSRNLNLRLKLVLELSCTGSTQTMRDMFRHVILGTIKPHHKTSQLHWSPWEIPCQGHKFVNANPNWTPRDCGWAFNFVAQWKTSSLRKRSQTEREYHIISLQEISDWPVPCTKIYLLNWNTISVEKFDWHFKSKY